MFQFFVLFLLIFQGPPLVYYSYLTLDSTLTLTREPLSTMNLLKPSELPNSLKQILTSKYP